MKYNLLIALVPVLLISCSSPRYLLPGEGSDKKHLIEFINENQKEGKLEKKPTVIIDMNFYSYDKLKNEKIPIAKEDIYKIRLLPLDENGKASGVEIVSNDYHNSQNRKSKADEVVVFLDKEKITKEEMQAINPNDIAAIEVIKSDSLLTKIGYQDYGGAIYVTTKKNVMTQYRNAFSEKSTDYKDYIVNIPINMELKLIAYLHNGKKMANKEPEYDIFLLSKKDIKRIDFMTNPSSLKKYKLENKTAIVNIITD